MKLLITIAVAFAALTGCFVAQNTRGKRAAAGQPSCSFGGWSAPTAVKVGSEALIGNAMIAGGFGSSFFVVGRTVDDVGFGPPTQTSQGLSVWQIQIESAGVKAKRLTSPPGVAAFIAPIGIVDHHGALNVLWGEPSSGRDTSDKGFSALRSATSVWHSTFSYGRWTEPERIAQFQRVEWNELLRSSLLATTDGKIALAVPIFEQSSRRGGIAYIVRSNGNWKLHSVFPGLMFEPGYVALAIQNGGHVEIAYDAAIQEKEPDENSVFILRSADGGTTWSKPQRVSVSGSHPALDLQLANERDGSLTLYWGQSKTSDLHTDVIRYVRSSDYGASWGSASEIDAAGALEYQILEGPCSKTLTIYTSYGSDHSDLYSALRTDEHWTHPSLLFPGWFAAGGSMWIDDVGCGHLIWVGAPADSILKLRRARLEYSRGCPDGRRVQ